jgi:hypothetical protein
MELTLEQAKELSEKKWQAIVDHDGEDSHIEQWVPEIDGMQNECAMCQYQLIEQKRGCEKCLYSEVCNGVAYEVWVMAANTNTSQKVLDKIKEINNN